MGQHAYHEYLNFNGASFFTAILLPDINGCFPTVICRSPYVKNTINISEDELISKYLSLYSAWIDRGYAVIFQHCRGQGKSTGMFVPYIHEREDGLELRRWLREQSFYNGEIFLLGASYTASLHYATAPFEPDIKGAVFEVQDYERYRLWYRNGQMRHGHANWHFRLYKPKSSLKKNLDTHTFLQLPLRNISEKALGERAEDFEQMLDAPSFSHQFWMTRFGGADARGATDNANIPILLATGYNDFYLGGMFKMWNNMDERTKFKSAMLVSPYDHNDGYDENIGLSFPCGKRKDHFGTNYQIDWFDNIRFNTPLPFKKGVITYYRTFENQWYSDFYARETSPLTIPLGNNTVSFTYNPLSPTSFKAEGSLQEKASYSGDHITIYTPPFEHDIFVKGKMRARLHVSSSACDTSFYINISIKKPSYEYILRHDITSLCHQLGNYQSNSEVELNFCFDEHAFLIEAGDSLRIDIASTNSNIYVPHTNKSGPYYLQNDTEIAVNKVYLSASQIIIPIEKRS